MIERDCPDCYGDGTVDTKRGVEVCPNCQGTGVVFEPGPVAQQGASDDMARL